MTDIPGALHVVTCGARFSGAPPRPESMSNAHDLGGGDDPRYPHSLRQNRRCCASSGGEEIKEVVSSE